MVGVNGIEPVTPCRVKAVNSIPVPMKLNSFCAFFPPQMDWRGLEWTAADKFLSRFLSRSSVSIHWFWLFLALTLMERLVVTLNPKEFPSLK